MRDPGTTTRAARAATGLTQREFAAMIGVSPITISLWETRNRRPSKMALSLLCLIERFGGEAVAELTGCHPVAGKT